MTHQLGFYIFRQAAQAASRLSSFSDVARFLSKAIEIDAKYLNNRCVARAWQ
jgi:hypothetical protein